MFTTQSCLNGSWLSNYWMMGGWGGMMLVWVIFLAIIMAGAYFLISGYFAPRDKEHDRALEIARERLGRGEITQEEFEGIKKTLS